jgi:hypothetical protein
LKIYERGRQGPRAARFADATEENLIILVKRTQVAIPRSRIDRIDCRPQKKPATITRTTRIDDNKPPADAPQGPAAGPAPPPSATPNYSSNTNVSFDPGDFHTVYARPGARP